MFFACVTLCYRNYGCQDSVNLSKTNWKPDGLRNNSGLTLAQFKTVWNAILPTLTYYAGYADGVHRTRIGVETFR